MILVDTSAWVEFDRATGSAVDNRLSGLIAEGAQIAVTEPVVMEVTTGARDTAREQDLRRLLGHCRLLPFDAAVDFDAASRNLPDVPSQRCHTARADRLHDYLDCPPTRGNGAFHRR